jgi:hypothetical protein
MVPIWYWEDPKLKIKLLKEKEKSMSLPIQQIKVEKKAGRSITTSDNFGNSITTTTVAGSAFLSPLIHGGPDLLIVDDLIPNKQEKNHMHIDRSLPQYAAREHLADRLTEAYNNHDAALRDRYHLSDTDTSSWSWADFVTAIKADQFVPKNPNTFTKRGEFNPWNLATAMRLRDPTKTADVDGFEKASEKMRERSRSVKDAIMIKDTVEALKEVDKFREATFH